MSIGIGLIGAGSFGLVLAEAAANSPEFELIAVCDLDADRAKAAALTYGIHMSETPEQLVSLARVDAVMIATSHNQHLPNTIVAATAGKHVFCEKPMAIDTAECAKMIDVCTENNVHLLIGHVTRLFPSVKRMHKIMKEDLIGRPIAMKMLRSAWVERRGWWTSTETSGGMMHSSGAHMFDLMASFLGRAVSIYAVAAPRVQLHTDFDDTIFSTIVYENNTIGTVDVSISGQAWVYGGGLIGDRGSMTFQFSNAPTSWVEYHARDNEPIREYFGTFDEEGLYGVALELQNFADVILQNAEPFNTNEAAMDAVALIQASYQSVRSGKVVAI